MWGWQKPSQCYLLSLPGRKHWENRHLEGEHPLGRKDLGPYRASFLLFSFDMGACQGRAEGCS